MASGPTIVARFLADTSKLTSDVDSATTTAGSKIGTFAKNAALALGGAFVATKVVDFGRDAVGAASDLSESISKVGVVFGQQGDDILSWSKNSAEAMGLSQQAALEAAGTYGNLAVSLGLPGDKAASMSTDLVELAADMASFNNVPVDEALKALQSGLTGETEPLKKFGVNLNDAALKAEAMALGLYNGQGPLDAAAKAQASYSLILKQSGTAQGDFARTSDGLANQQRIATAEMENLKAKLGTALLPVILQLTTVLTNVLLPAFESVFGWIMDNKDVVIAAVIALGAVLLPMFLSWAAGAAAAAAATLLAAAPFIAIGAVIAGVAYLIIHNWDTIVAVTKATWDAVIGAVKFVWDWIKNNWPLLLAILTGPFGAAVLLIVKNWDTIKAGAQAVWDWLNGTWQTITSIITAPIRAAVDIAKGIWGELKDAATGAYDWVRDKFKAMGDAISDVIGGIRDAVGKIVDAIKTPINAVIRAWNGLEFKVPSVDIPKVDIPGIGSLGGGKIGGQTIGFPNIPTLAAGGVLTSPTLFVGGEAGREIVSPEELLRQIVAEESGGGHYTLNMYPRTADAADVAYGFRRLELMAGAT